MDCCGCSRLWGCNEPIGSFLRVCTHPWMKSSSLGKFLGNPFFPKAINFPDGGQWSVPCRRTRGYWEETPLGRRWSEAGNWAGCYLPHWLAFIFPCLFPRHAASLGCVLPAVQRCRACCAPCPQSATPGWHCPLSVLWATVVASPAPSCHINRVSLAHICGIIVSPCVPGWSYFSVANCLTQATSAALAPSTLSRSLLQSLSSLQPRAILRKQMQA